MEDGAHFYSIRLDDDFEWDEHFFQVVGLDEEQTKAVQEATKEILLGLQQHEFDTKELVEEKDSEVIYRLPGDPDFLSQTKESFLSDLEEIGGKDLARLSQKAVADKLDNLGQDRLVSFRLLDENETSKVRDESRPPNLPKIAKRSRNKSYKLTVKTLDENGNPKGTSSRSIGFGGGKIPRDFGRYDHLFAIE